MIWFLFFVYMPSTFGGQTPQLVFFPRQFETSTLCDRVGAAIEEGAKKRSAPFYYVCYGLEK